MMALCPFAHHAIYYEAGREHTPVRMTLHTAWPGPAHGPLYHGAPAPNGTYAHFYIDADGTLYQTADTAQAARADLEGNYGTISVETWDGAREQPLNAAQLATARRLWAWVRDTHESVPNRIASVASTAGLAWHRLGCEGNFGAFNPEDMATWSAEQTGERWSGAYGKICPGTPKIYQIPAIFAGEEQGDEDMPTAQEIANALMDMPIERRGPHSSGHTTLRATIAWLDENLNNIPGNTRDAVMNMKLTRKGNQRGETTPGATVAWLDENFAKVKEEIAALGAKIAKLEENEKECA
ncbi:N-acetylmuramoyl-L-alanine amidase [Actinotignum sp. GS-2025e]|uniref:N-acetylmuramoyl-L-alanine amidase n=2 Tax=Actinomycetaceae TaxID=2049 RepID=UPI002551882D|nr:N-acetylmuramoyl-L-alanine amidase [Actinotignum timonense]MDK8283125.1 N-acetylmuramoyl-L-alanine amidase [Actinotignum timonense]